MRIGLKGALAAASLMLGSMSVASAADLPVRPRPVFAPPSAWNGLYIGGNLGAGWGSSEIAQDPPVQCFQTPGGFVPPPRCPGVTIVQVSPGVFAVSGGTVEAVTNASTALNGFLGGGQVGYNVQMGAWLVGAEIDGSAANIRGTGTCGIVGNNCTTKIDGLVTFAGRVGAIVMERGLIYVKAGGAWAHDKVDANFAGFGDVGSASGSRWG
jgi:outer membrane immunogenic protein